MKELRKFGKKSYTTIETLSPSEVNELDRIVDTLIRISKKDESVSNRVWRVRQLFDIFIQAFNKYRPDLWEDIIVEEDESSEVGGTKSEYRPFSYLMCIYTVFDSIINDNDEPEFESVESYINDLNKSITYKLT